MTLWLKKQLPSALILVLLWTVWRLAVLGYTGIPQPQVHDEFSYLLGADTFARGRLANSPHVLGQFFESPQVLVRPMYASKYPPGQALFLALGQRLFGSAFYGVLIGNAMMLFTFCLMLFAWVPYPWAMAVSVMFGLYLRPGMYWTNSYWGGSVAASGAALVLLGIGIHRARQTALAGAIFAVGVLLLFWTRPFEGGVFTLTALMVFSKELWHKRRPSVFLAAVLTLAIGGAWTCYDNQAVTGKPFLLPHLLHQRQYVAIPIFSFLPMTPEPTYSHPRLASLHGNNGWEESNYHPEQPRWRVLSTGLLASLRTLTSSFGKTLLFALLIPIAWRNPVYWRMAIITLVLLLALTIETFHFGHYVAPLWAALAVMIAVWAEGAWRLRVLKQPVGAALVLLAFSSPIVFPADTVLQLLRRTSWSSIRKGAAVPAPRGWPERRALLIDQLAALDRRQLVIVRYPSRDWNVREEWVYNGADIDNQRVVFAHDLGVEPNHALLRYYSDRTALLLTFDSISGHEQIDPYPHTPSEQ